MTLEEAYNLANHLGKPITFKAVWKDYYYPDNSNDGSISGFDNPEAAFKAAKEGAEDTTFSSVSYWVSASIGEVKVKRIDDYSGTT